MSQSHQACSSTTTNKQHTKGANKRTLEDLNQNNNQNCETKSNEKIFMSSPKVRAAIFERLKKTIIDTHGPINPEIGLSQGEIDAIRNAVRQVKKEFSRSNFY